MTKKRFKKGDWTNCRYDICEILKDEEYYLTVATKDADLVINILEKNEQLIEENNFLKKQLSENKYTE